MSRLQRFVFAYKVITRNVIELFLSELVDENVPWTPCENCLFDPKKDVFLEKKGGNERIFDAKNGILGCEGRCGILKGC